MNVFPADGGQGGHTCALPGLERGAPVWEDAVGGGVRGTRQCLLAACPRVSAAEGGERG